MSRDISVPSTGDGHRSRNILDSFAMPHERVIFIPFIFGFGGVERLALSLSRFLNETGVPHSIACFQDTIDLASYAEWPLAVNAVSARRNIVHEAIALRRSPVFQSNDAGSVLVFDLKGALYSQFIRRECVIHLTDPPSLLPTDITRDAFSAAATRAQSLAGLRHPLHSVRAEIAHRATRRGVRRAARVVVMTRVIAEELRRLYDVEATIVRPGVDTRNMRKTASSGNGLRILSISRLETSKRLHWVLSALAALNARSAAFGADRDWRFDIVGDGSQRRELEKLSSDLGLASRVRFHGWLDDDAAQRLTSESNLFIMPAAQGYGLPALESLVRGVPVIAHRDSGVSEILQSTPWVRLVSAPDGSDLGDAIAEMSAAISRGALRDYPVPMIPSETDWAAELSRICGWVGEG